MTTHRQCRKCGEEKPLEDFSPHARGKYGRQPRCKVCCLAANKARYYANLDESREKSRLRALAEQAANPEARNEARARWRAVNPDADRASKRKWLEANRPQKRAATEAWRKANLGKFNAAGKAWKKSHPEAMRIYQLRQYGLTPDCYEKMLAIQGGCCAICREPPSGKRNRLCVDHHHDSGMVRSLLCVRCNAGIGSFRENTRHLLSAVDYLVEHGSPGMFESAK